MNMFNKKLIFIFILSLSVDIHHIISMSTECGSYKYNIFKNNKIINNDNSIIFNDNKNIINVKSKSISLNKKILEMLDPKPEGVVSENYIYNTVVYFNDIIDFGENYIIKLEDRFINSPYIIAVVEVKDELGQKKSYIVSCLNYIFDPNMSNGLFEGCEDIIRIKILKSDNVTNMCSLFNGCSSLQQLIINNFNTSNVTNMSWMFKQCSSLNNLDLSNFDTKNVTDMECMFSECSSLIKLNLSNFNTSNVKNMVLMFYNCSSLIELNLSSFNTSSLIDMTGMFSECKYLKDLNLSNFNTEKVNYIDNMFDGCKNFNEIV